MNTIIKDILKNKINFSVFQINDLTEEQMEVVFHNLKSKIVKENDIFERMLENQKKSEDGFYNKKTIQIIIQYLLNENNYTIDDIKKIFNRIINIYEIMEEDIEEKTSMTELISELDLEEVESDDFTKYVNKLTIQQYKKLKIILKEENDVEDFLNEIIQPYIKYHFNKSEKFVSEDLILDFLSKLNNDKNEKNKEFYINIIIDYILSEGKILSIALNKEDIIVISNYVNVLKVNNNKLNKFIKLVNQKNIERITKNLPKDFTSYDEHSEHIDISGLYKKSDMKIIEIMYIIENLYLKTFLTSCGYDENKKNKIMLNLEKINIKTYYKLENLVLKNQFIKITRKDNKKILPGKIIKMIIYKIFDNNNKLELLNEKMMFVKEEITDIFNIQKHKNIQQNNKNNSIKNLKQQRINVNNLIILLKENNEDTTEHENRLEKIDNEIKQYILNGDTTTILNDNIDDLNEMMETMNLSFGEKQKMSGVVKNLKNEILNQYDIFGENFNKERESNFINRNIDRNLEKIIQKYENENKEDNKRQRKENFIQLQNQLVNDFLKNIISSIDEKYKVNNIRLYNMISDFIKHQINTKIIPRIYKDFNLGDTKYNRNEIIYQMLKMIIHMFMIVLNFINKKIDYSKVYDNLDRIINVNKKIKKVILKSNGNEVELIEEKENHVVISYLEEDITMKKTEVTFIEDLVGKEIKIIKGNHKGFFGKIYNQKYDYVLATRDTYGKNDRVSQLPRIITMKLKYNEFKVNQEEEDRKFIVENKELFDYYNNNDKKLYSMTKFEINKYYTVNNLNNFEQMYKLVIELVNDYKINEYNKYQKLRVLKKEYIQLKNKVQNNKDNKRVYISLNKKLKKLHKDIRNMEINIRLIKETLINKSDNLNDNYTYNKKDGLFYLKEHTIKIKTSGKYKKTLEEKKLDKKNKIQIEKQMRINTIKDMTTQITSILGDLLI